MLIHSLTPYYVLHTVTATDANTLTNTIVPYSGKFLRGSIFRGFCRELFTAKKRTREILNTCIQKHFALCTRGQTAVKEASTRFNDVYLPLSSTCQFSSTARWIAVIFSPSCCYKTKAWKPFTAHKRNGK